MAGTSTRRSPRSGSARSTPARKRLCGRRADGEDPRAQPGSERARPAGVPARAGRGDRIGPARRVQADAAAVHAQFDRVVTALADRYPDAAEHLDDARADPLAFTVYPREIWRQIWSNNPKNG